MNHRANLNERDDATSSNVVPFRPASPGEPQALGTVVAAVIMTLRGGLPRVICDRLGAWEEWEEPHPDGL